jgi:tRNA(fMet)-specific endonuclease VapC
VLCEIEAGVRQVRYKAKYRRDLNHLLLQLRLWPLDLKTTQLYGDAFIELRRRGRVLSQVDIMVAALARQLKLTILTTDTDFDALPDLRTEDWSKAPLDQNVRRPCSAPSAALFFSCFSCY